MSSVYRIGDLVLDTARQELRRGGELIHLGPLSYRLLLALVDAAPEVVSQDAVAAAVWSGRAVTPETISQRAKLLRQAIGDDWQTPRYIQVLRGRGYRLLPPVVPISTGSSARRPGRRALPIAASLVLAAAALVWRLSGPDPPAQPSPSIAVLPFADMSPARDQEYFADGMAEEILNLLSDTTSLRVTARTSSFSFRNKDADIPTIAEKLNVSHVLQGSVRRSENRVRVAVQLVAGADGTHLWSETYERELSDVLRLQQQIASSVAGALEVNLFGHDSPGEQMPTRVKPAAFDAYLRGRREIASTHRLAEAERHLKQSIEIDAGFVPAYSSLGLVYVMQTLEVNAPIAENTRKLREIVQQGLAMAPEHPALIGLSGQLARYDRNMQLAEERLRRALELDPSNVPIVMLYAMFKQDQGYPREALRVTLRLLQRDPLNSMLYILVWACHMDLGDASDAMDAAMRFNEAVGVPSAVGFTLRGWARVVLSGDLAGGIRDSGRALEIDTTGAAGSYGWPALYYDIGDLEQGDAALETYRRAFSPEAVNFGAVYRYLVTGEAAKARELALQTVTARRAGYAASYDDPALMRLATDVLIAAGEARRAIELIERMAPVYAGYRSRTFIDPREFSPAPYAVKSTYSSYPALYFPDYIRALRAAGDDLGADNMLAHLEAILQLRRKRGLFLEERHVAEARALRGDPEGALDALEQAERDRTVYARWHVFLLHNEIFAELRRHPRFQALIGRVKDEMRRQRAELDRAPAAPL